MTLSKLITKCSSAAKALIKPPLNGIDVMNAAQSVISVKVEFGNGDTGWFDVVEVNDSGELKLSDTMWVDDKDQVWNSRDDEHATVDWWGEVIDYAVYNAEINDIMTLSKLSMPRSTGGEK